MTRMKTIDTQSWPEFKKAIIDVKTEYGVFQQELPDGKTYTKQNDILYRGHSNTEWNLTTTLERSSNDQMDVLDYCLSATRYANEIESFTGINWNIPQYPELTEIIKKMQNKFRPYLPVYSYLVYLRHHGFPSPLLDWTSSPYIAAYFALAELGADKVAIFCYIERPEAVKGGSVGKPAIHVQGPFVTTHKRHFAQKASYTICTRWDSKNKNHIFCPHNKVFERPSTIYNQDILIKITLPASERRVALRQLSEYNINFFTLFQTEESLVRTLAIKEFEERKKTLFVE